MSSREHWENVYRTKAADGVSWFQEHATESLRLIEATGVSRHSPLIDIGGGASRLVDELLARGYDDITVLDLSLSALEKSRERLGEREKSVAWLQGDVLQAKVPERTFALWHDRAVFHFLTDAKERAAYVARVRESLAPEGHVVIATFSENGPERCSGLPVQRYSADSLRAEFGDSFSLVEHTLETHRTPFGTTQEFVFCRFRIL